MLFNYDISLDNLYVYYNKTSVVNISNNAFWYTWTKHIDIHHYYIRKLVESGAAIINHVSIENQLVDIIINAIDGQKFVTNP